MPKFVPVVDNEKSQLEQRGDTEFDKHRRFDNPHKVDRGWQQGNVGWGVLGAFGSNNKDDAAQVIKRSEGSNKMIKNEKGLWVKAKELEDDTPQLSKPGRGRGGGVSVYDDLAGRSMGSTETIKSSNMHKSQYDDADERRNERGSKKSSDSRDRLDDRRRDDRHRNDRDRDSYNKSKRSKSRSPDRRRDDRDRRDSRRSPDRHRRRDRPHGRSRSRSNDRHHRREDSRSRGDRDSGYTQDRDHDRNREAERRNDRDSRDDKCAKRDRRSPVREEPSSKQKVSRDDALSAEEAALQAEMMRSITAVQVINRFHEVFGQEKLFVSERLSSIGQVFSPDAVIASLKSGVVHITGKTGVEDSFAKTTASVPAISKRIYMEHSAGEAGEEPSDVSTSPKVTFCLDFHRPGTAPGLGDKSKHTVLLYRCESAQITHIWGMVDHEQLSQPEDLEKSVIMKSKVWGLVKPLAVQDVAGFDEAKDAHFHNYDRMEVWGMF